MAKQKSRSRGRHQRSHRVRRIRRAAGQEATPQGPPQRQAQVARGLDGGGYGVNVLQIHGHDVAYRAAGNGPVVVLVHGMAGSSATWEQVIPRLAERFTVVAPDLPGHGESAKPHDGDYSLGAFASSVRDLMVTLGHPRATIVGQSLGGGVAMQFAYQFPTRCERLVLVGSGGLGREVTPLLRALAFPGIELLFPVLFAQIWRDAGRGVARGSAARRPAAERVPRRDLAELRVTHRPRDPGRLPAHPALGRRPRWAARERARPAPARGGHPHPHRVG